MASQRLRGGDTGLPIEASQSDSVQITVTAVNGGNEAVVPDVVGDRDREVVGGFSHPKSVEKTPVKYTQRVVTPVQALPAPNAIVPKKFVPQKTGQLPARPRSNLKRKGGFGLNRNQVRSVPASINLPTKFEVGVNTGGRDNQPKKLIAHLKSSVHTPQLEGDGFVDVDASDDGKHGGFYNDIDSLSLDHVKEHVSFDDFDIDGDIGSLPDIEDHESLSCKRNRIINDTQQVPQGSSVVIEDITDVDDKYNVPVDYEREPSPIKQIDPSNLTSIVKRNLPETKKNAYPGYPFRYTLSDAILDKVRHLVQADVTVDVASVQKSLGVVVKERDELQEKCTMLEENSHSSGRVEELEKGYASLQSELDALKMQLNKERATFLEEKQGLQNQLSYVMDQISIVERKAILDRSMSANKDNIIATLRDRVDSLSRWGRYETSPRKEPVASSG